MRQERRDPYKVLGVPYDATILQIRQKFKKLILITHPDKGGSDELFQIVKNAYQYIFDLRKKQESQLNKENQTLDRYTKTRNMQDEKFGGNDIRNNVLSKEVKSEFGRKKVVFSKENFDAKQFNNLFNEYKKNNPEDPEERGYGNPYENGGKRMSDEQIRAIEKEQVEEMELVIHRDPEPIELNKGMQYKNLGVDKVDSFGKNTGQKGTGYSDYRQAYTQYKNINTMGNVRTKEYKNMSEYKNARSKQKFEQTDEELGYYTMKGEEQKAMEALRQHRVHENDLETEKAYNTLNRMISFR